MYFEKENIRPKINPLANNGNIGGIADSLSMLAIGGAIMTGLPPFSAAVSSLPQNASIIVQSAIMCAAFLGAYQMGHSGLKKYRLQFVLKSTAQVESSDMLDKPFKESGLLLGYTTDSGDPLYISDENLTRHMLITGQTGMGKSVFGKLLMFQQIQRGGGMLFIDGKLDQDNIQDIYEFACYCGRKQDFLVINPGNPTLSNTYNPILYGDADEVAARILSLIPSTSISAGSDHYKQSANQALVSFVAALKEAHLDYNFRDLALLTMNETSLESLVNHVKQAGPESDARKNLEIFLDQYAKDQHNDANTQNLHTDMKKLKEVLGGIGSRMHQFGTGNFGPVLNSYNPEVRIYDAIKEGKIVYAALPTMGKDVAAQNLGKMIISDLKTAISWLQLNKEDRPKIPFLAFMDEMSSYAVESLAVMFEQARSARVALVPAIQTDSGLSNISEDFKERILANTETKIYFKLSSDDTATNAESMVGLTRRIISSESAGQTQSSSAQSLQVGPQKNSSDGESNQIAEREQEEPYVSAGKFKGLGIGESIILRGQKVWNVLVPMIYLDDETKKSIGDLQINHSKVTKPKINGKVNKDFDQFSQVDQNLEKSRNKRIMKKKEKTENG